MWSSRLYRVGIVSMATSLGVAALAAEDLSTLRVEGQRAQSADQARRDRYECHNWAVEQTGQTPVAVPRAGDRNAAPEPNKRAERFERVLKGAAIGAGVGGIVGSARREWPNHGVLAGAAVGAAIGAATGGGSGREDSEPLSPPSDYLRALTACLEGRGYAVSLPNDTELSASAERATPR